LRYLNIIVFWYLPANGFFYRLVLAAGAFGDGLALRIVTPFSAPPPVRMAQNPPSTSISAPIPFESAAIMSSNVMVMLFCEVGQWR